MYTFTGPRFIDSRQEKKVFEILLTLGGSDWYVGDADGVDALVVTTATRLKKKIYYFETGGTEKWRFAERSKRMINEFIKDGGRILYAFPNKDCPDVCYPGSKTWGGSGTWGTIGYARSKGLIIALCPIADIKIPNWYIETGEVKPRPGQQMTLF